MERPRCIAVNRLKTKADNMMGIPPHTVYVPHATPFSR